MFPALIYDKQDRKLVRKDTYCIVPPIGAGPQDKSRGLPLLFDNAWKEKVQQSGVDADGAFGIYFDADTWTGSDFFTFPNSGTVCVTTKLVQMLQNSRITGIALTPALEDGKDLRDDKVAYIRKRYGHDRN